MNEIRELIDKLNYYTKLYDEGKPEITDEEWDDLYFKLVQLEKETGEYYEDSPTQKVLYFVENELKKVEHSHPMLSLDKTKDINVIQSYFANKMFIAMAKMDGLTCSLTYENGRLIRAETRGNGIIGEDITHNALVVKNIPNKINYKNRLVVDGEIICTYKNFEKFKDEYKNPRNFASGSIRLLNSKECEKRNLSFITWDVIEGIDKDNLINKLIALEELGFTIVPFQGGMNLSMEWLSDKIKDECSFLGYPIDGIVFKYANCEEYEAAGRTDHHFKGGLAYKFYDDEYISKLTGIEWSMGRTGQICPIALFEKLNIDGTEVSRASLSNISIMEQTLGKHPFIGQEVIVTKRNQIIPKIEKAKGEDGSWI